ncbi:ACT domain-containing protein [Tropicimonas sp. IMCC34043]|uniref:ACT domain-containing protein n=1 Tax=Tropicimonas sp. IMCC34043 TaxID=2248760 RepID=UPI000E24F8C7|nr:ACT domain-containing protein [Tropicimonas sp. IMCC34043]
MAERVTEGRAMVRAMAPRLLSGRFAFRSVTDPADAARLLPEALASFREDEGLSLILPAAEGVPAFRQITLDVLSALDGVGLTAAVSAALAAHDIPCNVVAANNHDHVFVPDDRAEAALAVLLALSLGQDALAELE